jgi:hypothetical protein
MHIGTRFIEKSSQIAIAFHEPSHEPRPIA